MDENDMDEQLSVKIKNNKFKKIVTNLKSLLPKKYTKLETNNQVDNNKTKELPPPVYPKY